MNPRTTGIASFLGGVILALFAIIGGVGAITPAPNGSAGTLVQYDGQ